MKISINENYLHGRAGGSKENLALIKKAGFDAVDFSIDVVEANKYIERAKEYREFCESIGLTVNQSHAPFFEGCPMPEDYGKQLLRAVEASAILGADVLVVHADTWYEKDYVQWDIDTVINKVYEVYAPVVEHAEKCGIKIGMEMLFEWLGSLSHRVRLCSTVEELDAIAGRFHTNTVGVCWDFGHASMAYKKEQFEAMKRLKTKIIATHIHDNISKFDNHNLPFQGNVDWDKGMQTMAQLGYSGDLTFEIHYGVLPDSLVLEFLRYSHKVGEHLMNRFKDFQIYHLK